MAGLALTLRKGTPFFLCECFMSPHPGETFLYVTYVVRSCSPTHVPVFSRLLHFCLSRKRLKINFLFTLRKIYPTIDEKDEQVENKLIYFSRFQTVFFLVAVEDAAWFAPTICASPGFVVLDCLKKNNPLKFSTKCKCVKLKNIHILNFYQIFHLNNFHHNSLYTQEHIKQGNIR